MYFQTLFVRASDLSRRSGNRAHAGAPKGTLHETPLLPVSGIKELTVGGPTFLLQNVIFEKKIFFFEIEKKI